MSQARVSLRDGAQGDAAQAEGVYDLQVSRCRDAPGRRSSDAGACAPRCPGAQSGAQFLQFFHWGGASHGQPSL
eukprot:2937839-Prymnesium_polylepis.1